MEAVFAYINWIDATALILVLGSSIFAYFRGFTHELFSIFGWTMAIILAVNFFADLTPFAAKYILDPLLAQIASGAAIFFISMVISGLINGWVSRRVLASGISSLDRSLGFLYGLVRGAILVSITFLTIHQLLGEGTRPDVLKEAKVTPFAAEGSRLLVRIANAILPQHLHMNAPESILRKMQNDAKKAFYEQTVPIQRLNQVTENVKKAKQILIPAPLGTDVILPEVGYSKSDSDSLDALIEKELNQ